MLWKVKINGHAIIQGWTIPKYGGDRIWMMISMDLISVIEWKLKQKRIKMQGSIMKSISFCSKFYQLILAFLNQVITLLLIRLNLSISEQKNLLFWEIEYISSYFRDSKFQCSAFLLPHLLESKYTVH